MGCAVFAARAHAVSEFVFMAVRAGGVGHSADSRFFGEPVDEFKSVFCSVGVVAV